MAAPPTRVSDLPPYSELRKLKLIDAVSVNCGRLIRYGAVVLIFRYGYYSVLALSGKLTMADVFIRFLSNFDFKMSVSWALTASGVGWGLAERRLRKRTVRKMAPRIKKLERMVDPDRTSSSLMDDGSTRPEDEEK